jgi:hypothetical protein
MAPAGTAFDREQFDAIYPIGVERHYWNRCRNRVIHRMLLRIGAQGPMIEVGCGKGLVVRDLRARGHEVVGVELAEVKALPDASAWVRTGTDALALPGTEARIYRTLLLLDVIEHLAQPELFVQQLREAFPGVEWIVATVPARQELFSAHDTFNRHFRRYDLDTLRAHLDPEQKTEWHASYFFHSLYPPAWLQARLARDRRRFTAPAVGIESVIHAVIASALCAEHRLLPGTWPGTSIIAASRAR